MAEEADKQVDDMIKRGVIEKLNSPMGFWSYTCKKEGWKFQILCRLQSFEQCHSERHISTAQNRLDIG